MFPPCSIKCKFDRMEDERIKELIATLVTSSSLPSSSNNLNSSNNDSTSLPTTLQLYQIGLVLYNHKEDQLLHKAYQDWIRYIPYSYLSQVLLHEIHQAYALVVANSCSSNNNDDNDDNNDTIVMSSRALAGLYFQTPYACQAGHSILLLQTLETAYQEVRRKRQQNEADMILETLTAILMDGFLSKQDNNSDNDDDDERRLHTLMEGIQALTGDDTNSYPIMADLQDLQYKRNPTITLQHKINTTLPPTPQRDYLLMMITTATTNENKINATEKLKSTKSHQPKKHQPSSSSSLSSQPVDPRQEILRRIEQVKQVVPHFGDGYVETALSHYHGNVETTVAALLDGTSLPPTLIRLDPNLPARFKEATPNHYVNDDDEEARRLSKASFRKMEQEQEAEAYALTVMMTKTTITTTSTSNTTANEYDDDYDDQYDDFDGGVGVGDTGGMDVDFDTIRTYNKAALETEREASFWNETRNTNRGQKVISGKARLDEIEGPEREYRGNDKIKGGRPIGPDGKVIPRQKGGKKNTGTSNPPQSSQMSGTKPSSKGTPANQPSGDGVTELTKLQKHRKMLNKAKAGNHHRKDAAQRKTGGMG